MLLSQVLLYVPMAYAGHGHEIVSTSFIAVCAAATIVIVPLSDSLPLEFGKPAARFGGVVVAAAVGSDFVYCELRPAGCLESLHDFQWTVPLATAPANTTSVNIASLNQSQAEPTDTSPALVPTVSTFDSLQSSPAIVTILAPQMVFGSFYSPDTTNGMQEPFGMQELHAGDADAPGCLSVAATILGAKNGMVIRRWMEKGLGTGMVATFFVCYGTTFSRHIAAYTISTLVNTAAIISILLIMRPAVLKHLAKTLPVWYNVASICAGRAMQVWLMVTNYGSMSSIVAQSCNHISLACLMICVLALIDAVPKSCASQRVRVATWAAVAIFNMANFIRAKVSGGWLYAEGSTPLIEPKLVADGFVQLSCVDVLNKSYLTISLLSMHQSYHAWRFQDEAVLVKSGIPFSKLHQQAKEGRPESSYESSLEVLPKGWVKSGSDLPEPEEQVHAEDMPGGAEVWGDVLPSIHKAREQDVCTARSIGMLERTPPSKLTARKDGTEGSALLFEYSEAEH